MNTVLPISIVPPVAYMAAAMRKQKAVIDYAENYIHQTIRNRYHLAGPNGVIALTINVKGQKGVKIPTSEIQIDYSKPWQRQHLRTIEAAYRSAPFFEHYSQHTTALLSGKENTLGELFHRTWPLWLKLLKIAPEYEIAMTNPTGDVAADLRARIKEPEWFAGKAQPVKYQQVFNDRFGFTPHLSILDLLFNEGPAAAIHIGAWLE